MKNKKKIAIMTWHTYQNLGSVLQASALCNVVNGMGYMASLIQYLPKGNVREAIKTNLLKLTFNKVKGRLKPLYESEERSQLFTDYFNERCSYTQECTSYSDLYELNEKYSAFICGSDQIWAPLCYDSKFFLDFVDNVDKMIAYAPSIGMLKVENEVIQEQMAKNISRFKHLSVREKQGAEVIRKLTGKEAEIVLDPTLLMKASEWDTYVDYESASRIADKKYILCYFLGDAEKYMNCVRILSKRMKIPFYVVPVTMSQKRQKQVVPFEVGPREFVSLIRNAAYVCTDSFHAVAFSINYNIPFSVFKRFKDNEPKNQNSRIYNLLAYVKLEERLLDYKKKSAKWVDVMCNFEEANKRLESGRKLSLAYLQDALQMALISQTKKKEDAVYKITDICCGCGACATVCAKEAISICKDGEGFEQYMIDLSKCVQCEQCKKVCPMLHIEALHMKESKMLYSIKSRSQQVLKCSSSGGAAHEMASMLQKKGYAICGCTYDVSDNSAKHIWLMPDEKEKISLLQGSKYIQSMTFDALNELVKKTKENNIVFFGTPCQVAAADKLLRKSGIRERAVLIDLICHGVPTYYLWDKYIKDINEKYHTGEHPSVLFRSKQQEWRRRLLLVAGNGHTYKKEEHKDDFYAFFRHGLCYMESCLDCPYRERSAADIRMGDYWGKRFEKDKEGVSMVIANTSYGQELINCLGQSGVCQLESQDLHEYWSVQYPYNQQRPLVREQLIYELKNEQTDIHSLRKKYCFYYDYVETCSRIVVLIKRVLRRK